MSEWAEESRYDGLRVPFEADEGDAEPEGVARIRLDTAREEHGAVEVGEEARIELEAGAARRLLGKP